MTGTRTGGNLGRSQDASRESATDIIGQCFPSRASPRESPIPSSPLSSRLLCSVHGGLSTFRFELPFHSLGLFSLLDQYQKFPTGTTRESGTRMHIYVGWEACVVEVRHCWPASGVDTIIKPIIVMTWLFLILASQSVLYIYYNFVAFQPSTSSIPFESVVAGESVEISPGL